MVQAPPNAVAGKPAINASAAAAAHQRLGPARVKTMPPNANYAVLQGLKNNTEKKRQLFHSVKGKSTLRAEKTQYTQRVVRDLRLRTTRLGDRRQNCLGKSVGLIEPAIAASSGLALSYPL
jgi:hypothetical protein